MFSFVLLIVAISFAYASAYYDRRAYCIIAVNFFAVIGFAIFLGTPLSATKTRYGAVFLTTMGIYTPGPIWLSFGMANAGLDQMRAVAAGLLVGLGTMGSIGEFAFFADTANEIEINVAISSQSPPGLSYPRMHHDT